MRTQKLRRQVMFIHQQWLSYTRKSLSFFHLSSTAFKNVDYNSDYLLYRFPKDAAVFLLLLVYSPVGICLMLMRIFIGVHVFLVSCALPESFVRR